MLSNYTYVFTLPASWSVHTLFCSEDIWWPIFCKYLASPMLALYVLLGGRGKLPEHFSCIGEWGEIFWLLFLFAKLGTDPRTLCMLGICVCVCVCRYICIYTNIKIYTFICIYLNKMAQIYKKTSHILSPSQIALIMVKTRQFSIYFLYATISYCIVHMPSDEKGRGNHFYQSWPETFSHFFHGTIAWDSYLTVTYCETSWPMWTNFYADYKA